MVEVDRPAPRPMDKTMSELEQTARPAARARRRRRPCATCGRRTADPQIQRRPTKKERRTARAEDVLDLASKYARTHRDALTRGEALRFLGDHVAELPNVSLLRRGAAYALAASRAAPAEFYGGDGTPHIPKRAVPECLARTVRKTLRRRAYPKGQSKHLDGSQPEPGRRVAMAGFI